jgi:hypothetical protein
VELFALFRPDFPTDDVTTIASVLMESGILIPGYITPEVGLLAIEALEYARHVLGQTTVLLPDRNLVSEMAKIPRVGGIDPAQPNALTAARLMAFCQSLDIMIEPSIAYHELAGIDGNEAAHEELAWFRSADHAHARAWIDLAMGRTTRLPPIPPPEVERRDLQYPLRRWRSNYAVALKIAELELADLAPVERHRRLVAWMVEDFTFAGPAAVFSAMYFAPRAPRRGMFKNLRSEDRDRALAGVRNAAWDMTTLSDFIRKIPEGEASGERYILATLDRALAAAAPLVLLDRDGDEDTPGLGEALAAWWPPHEAANVAATLFDHHDRVLATERPTWSADRVDARITEGEDRLRAWRPIVGRHIAPPSRASEA